MKVIEIKKSHEDIFKMHIAVVESEGVRSEARLDIVDHVPEVGDYVIIHAGFAIHTLDPVEAEENLDLMRQMAASLETHGPEKPHELC